MYRIIDNQTGLQVGKDYTNRSRAIRRADKLDMQYGAIRYIVIGVKAVQSATQVRAVTV